MPARPETQTFHSVPQGKSIKSPKDGADVVIKSSSRSSSVDSLRHEEHHERTESYSSVREVQDGLPQSFIISAKRTLSLSGQEDGIIYGNESAIYDDLAKSTESLVPTPSTVNLGNLPAEIQERILESLILDVPPTEYTPRNADLMACLLTGRALCMATIRVLYKQVTFPHSNAFHKFMNRLRAHPELGRLVRRFDLSHFSSLGMGRTKQLNLEIQNLTSRTLLECLKATNFVTEVLLQEHVDQDVDTYVLQKLFFGLKRLEALDLCASSTRNFVESFSNAVSRLREDSELKVGLQRLCLHECFTILSTDIELLLSRLPNLTVLDLHHTRVTDAALEKIPHTARLTHLNLGRCPTLTAEGVLHFLRTHPAASTLVWLNVSCDVTRWRLFEENDVSELLSLLPPSLCSLNINGAKVTSAHVPLLRSLTRHLEELGVAYSSLTLADVSKLFENPNEDDVDADWTPCALHYIDLTGLSSVSQSALFSWASTLLSEQARPLEVIEISSKVATALTKTYKTNRSLGWCVKELGRRSWYVREQTNGDDGKRDWKMGSRWWGMKKSPVAWSEVGGIYGHYMFKT